MKKNRAAVILASVRNGAKFSAKQVSEAGASLASGKWQVKTPKQRSAHGKMMVDIRERKRKEALVPVDNSILRF